MHHRLSVLAYHFKTAVDCFFAVWFVVGNVWIFGGRSISSDAQDAPNMYRYMHFSLFFRSLLNSNLTLLLSLGYVWHSLHLAVLGMPFPLSCVQQFAAAFRA
jgi:hypothetical protein